MRCRRVARTVVSPEVRAVVLGFDKAFVIRHLFAELLGRSVELHVYVQINTVFDTIAKDGQTNERRQQMDMCALR